MTVTLEVYNIYCTILFIVILEYNLSIYILKEKKLAGR